MEQSKYFSVKEDINRSNGNKIIKYTLEESALSEDFTGKGLYSALEEIITDIAGKEEKFYTGLNKIYDFTQENEPFKTITPSLLKKKVDECYNRESTGTKYYITLGSGNSYGYKNIISDCLKDENFIEFSAKSAVNLNGRYNTDIPKNAFSLKYIVSKILLNGSIIGA